MVFNPIWLNWLEEDEEGNLTILREDAPENIKKEYKSLIEEEQESIRKNKLKRTIF